MDHDEYELCIYKMTRQPEQASTVACETCVFWAGGLMVLECSGCRRSLHKSELPDYYKKKEGAKG